MADSAASMGTGDKSLRLVDTSDGLDRSSLERKHDRSGDMSPTVQIAAQPLSDEGLLCLLELVNSKDDLVRNGVLALLAKRETHWSSEATSRASNSRSGDSPSRLSCGGFQGATYLLRQNYEAINDDLQPFRESLAYQESAWRAFYKWAMQWH